MGRSTSAAAEGGRFRGFGSELATFLVELEMNNRRDWFEANRERYERDVREPARAFIRAMGPRIARISSHFRADDRKVGGSLMRVHRDVRFSKDKTPYKSNVGIQFRHAWGKDAHAPGFYVHIGTDECFVGVGTWRPDAASLGAIRQKIVAEPQRWRRIVGGKRFSQIYRLGGESLKRPPRGVEGVDADHPLLDDLKRKDHVAVAPLGLEELESEEVVARVAKRFAAAKPYVAFLCEAIDVPF